jgi:polar amino acid transport system substrate-binding protein
MTIRIPLLGLVAILALSTLTACTGAKAQAPTPHAVYDAALHDSLPAEVRDGGVLSIATDASYPPASFFDEDGRTVVGFEPELAAAIARTLGVEVEFVVMGFDDTLDAVAAGKADLVMTAMTDTPERQRQVDFVNYFSAGTSIVVQEDNPFDIADLSDLCGQTVAVEQGTVQVDLLARHQRTCRGNLVEVHEHGTNSDALLELRTGRAAAVLNDYPPAAYLANDARTGAEFDLASVAQYEPGLYGIAVSKDRPELRQAIRTALAHVISAGEYQAILERWDVEDGGIPGTSVNAGR